MDRDDRLSVLSPRANATGMRVLLHVIELMPLAMGFGGRLRRLPVPERVRWLEAVERNPNPRLRQLTKLVKGAAFLSYYGDDAIMRRLGYDADANVARGRELRAREGRP
jgi:hypothetical protein